MKMKMKVRLHRAAARRAVTVKQPTPHIEKAQGTAVIRGSLVWTPTSSDSTHRPKAIQRPYPQDISGPIIRLETCTTS